jgi:hypothetical protein
VTIYGIFITKQTSLSQKLTTILTEANQYGRLVLLNAMCLSNTQHGHHHIMIGPSHVVVVIFSLDQNKFPRNVGDYIWNIDLRWKPY